MTDTRLKRAHARITELERQFAQERERLPPVQQALYTAEMALKRVQLALADQATQLETHASALENQATALTGPAGAIVSREAAARRECGTRVRALATEAERALPKH
jgi:hypothetical protein